MRGTSGRGALWSTTPQPVRYDRTMTLLIDPPSVASRGMLWSHLASDRSLDELHAFARSLGIPGRGFDRDHYDVPAQRYDAVVAAGAVPVSSREVVRRLRASGLRRRKAQSLGRRAVGQPLTRPRRLRAGDEVAVVAPAGPVPADRLAGGLRVLDSWGLRVRPGRHVYDRSDYLAGVDADRADDFMRAWTDLGISAVFAARGGYGTQRIIDLLDWVRLVDAGPKVLCGFSDLTALHQGFAAILGLVTIHGPVVTSLGVADAETVEHARRILFESESALELIGGHDTTALVPGVAEGILVGGNLSLLAAEVGTPASRRARGSLVLLEDCDEEPYRIDRSLTQLLRSGWFDGVRGILLGSWVRCGTPDQMRRLLADRLTGLGVPILCGLPIGHGAANHAVPLGVPARLDTSAGTLTLIGPALA
jgi:muramoyltetrapeptide carboxypeptidase